MTEIEHAPYAGGDRNVKKSPFAWMKRLANLRSSSNNTRASKRRDSPGKSKKSSKRDHSNVSERSQAVKAMQSDDSTASQAIPMEHSTKLAEGREHGSQTLGPSNGSLAPTLETNPDTINSEAEQSHAGTGNTLNGGMSSISGGGNSIFSKQNDSGHSLTTTLTTIQSTAPSTVLQGPAPTSQNTSRHQQQPSQGSSYFTHQFPVTPASAVPAHVTNPSTNASHVPITYRSAIANNLLSDNASVLTLASSSNRRQRRNSDDTDASIRALPPASTWGASRESLPLSVLSHNLEAPHSGATTPVGGPGAARRSLSGLGNVERANVVYSSSGVNAPALSSDRNSVYAGRDRDGASSRAGGDGASMRAMDTASIASIKSGVPGMSGVGGGVAHGRSDSLAGSIGAGTTASAGALTTATAPGASALGTPKEERFPTDEA